MQHACSTHTYTQLRDGLNFSLSCNMAFIAFIAQMATKFKAIAIEWRLKCTYARRRTQQEHTPTHTRHIVKPPSAASSAFKSTETRLQCIQSQAQSCDKHARTPQHDAQTHARTHQARTHTHAHNKTLTRSLTFTRLACMALLAFSKPGSTIHGNLPGGLLAAAVLGPRYNWWEGGPPPLISHIQTTSFSTSDRNINTQDHSLTFTPSQATPLVQF